MIYDIFLDKLVFNLGDWWLHYLSREAWLNLDITAKIM